MLRSRVVVAVMALVVVFGVGGGLLFAEEDGAEDLEERVERLNRTMFRLVDEGKPREAVDLAREVLEIRRADPDSPPRDVALALNNLAYLVKATGRPNDALPLFLDALEIARGLHQGPHPDVGRALNNLADCLVSLDRLDEALRLHEASLAMRRELAQGEDDAKVADSLNNLAQCLMALGRADKALPLFEEALTMRRGLEPGPSQAVVTGMGNLATCLTRVGRVADAFSLEKQALEVAIGIHGPDHPDVALRLGNLGCTLDRLGRAREAVPLHERALEVLAASLGREHPAVATAMGNLASSLEALGEAGVARALPLREQALTIARGAAGGDGARVVMALSNLAGSLRELGRLPEALGLYEEARAMQQRLTQDDHPETARALGNVAVTLMDLGRLEEALALCEEALAMQRRLPASEPAQTSWLVDSHANILFDLGRHAEALPLYEQALATLRRLHPKEDHPDVAFLSSNLANCHLALGRPDLAIPLMEVAVAMADKLGSADRYAWSANLGAMYMGAGELQEAIVHLRRAVDATDELREGTGGFTPDERIAYFSHLKSLGAYDLLILACAQTGTEGEALGVLERARGRTLLDLFEGRASSLGTARAMDDIRAALGADERLVAYAQRKDGLLAFVAGPPGVAARHWPLHWPEGGEVSPEALREAVDEYRTAIAERRASRGILVLDPEEAADELPDAGRLAHRLFTTLVPPALWDEIRGAKRIVLLPDAALHRLPFEALVVDPPPEGGSLRYWLDDGPAIAYAPSGSAWLTCRELADSPGRATPSLEAVIVGDPDFQGGGEEAAHPPRPLLVPLPGTRREAEAVAAALRDPDGGDVRLLLDSDATEPAVIRWAPDARYLHFATHHLAGRGDDALRAGLALTRPVAVTATDDGILRLGELLDGWGGRLSSCEMVVLSACETNVGPLPKDEGVFAIPWGFHYAGCPSVVASLWRVDDESAADLMAAFYAKLKERGDRSKLWALNEARRATRAKRPEPHHWAPFVFLGDPR